MIKKNIPSPQGSLSVVIQHPTVETGKLSILCSGYLDAKDYIHLVRLADELVEKGYATVRFDPTGTWESSGDISDYTTTNYIKDVTVVLDYMLSQKKYGHVLLGGYSRGGMISILSASRDQRISAVLGIMPSSARSPVGKFREDWKASGFSFSSCDTDDGKPEKREYRVPYSHVEDRDRYNVIEEVKMVHVPIILLAGETDDQVLPKDVKIVYESANEPKFFKVILGVGHGYRRSDEEIRIVNHHVFEALKSLKLL